LINVALLVVAGWLIFWFSSDDAFYVNALKVQGNRQLSRAELMASSGLEGVNIFWVNTRSVEQAIEALPGVKSARVRCSLPADCIVDVVEHSALFLWRQGDAEIWIGSDGVVLPARGELPNAIVLNAVGSAAPKPGERLDPVLVNAVEELERLQPEVRVYLYTDQYGLSFWSAHGWQVRLGPGQQIETKLILLRALTDHLWNEGITPAFIDVRYPEAPYYGEQSKPGDPEHAEPNGF
jgi:cell division septal protein FtsQ